MQNWTKSRKSDMSGPAKTCPGGQVLTANQRKSYYFFRNYTFPFVIHKFNLFYQIMCFTKQIYHFFVKSCVLLNKFIVFYKIMHFINTFIRFCKVMCFTEQIYEDKSLSQKHVFTVSFSDFTFFYSYQQLYDFH